MLHFVVYFCTFAAKLHKHSAIIMDNQQEIFPLVDEEGTVVGSATRGECHSGSKLLHPVVHLHVFNSRGEVYLQRRPDWKDIQPGKWDTAVGGHIDYGENPSDALRREVREELGIEARVGCRPCRLTESAQSPPRRACTGGIRCRRAGCRPRRPSRRPCRRSPSCPRWRAWA